MVRRVTKQNCDFMRADKAKFVTDTKQSKLSMDIYNRQVTAARNEFKEYRKLAQ